MSKEPEENINPEVNLPDAAGGSVPKEAGHTEKTVDSKIIAIKAALQENEHQMQQEKMQMQIADKVKKYKSGKTSSPEDSVSDGADASQAGKEKKAETDKKLSAKKRSRKKKKKKKRSGMFLPRKGDGILEIFRKVVFLSSSAVFVVCLCLIGNYFWENHQNAKLMDEMQKIYLEERMQGETETEPPTEDTSYEYYGMMASAKNLIEINPDVAGWISIPDTKISYPLMQRKHPDEGETEPNDYYLTRNIRKEETRAGSIFLDYRANFDYVVDHRLQAPNTQNLVVYGHNMRDYSMFGSLKEYVNTAGYYEAHPIVELNSNYRKYVYKIFAMIIVDIDDETETKFDYWNKLDFADEADFYNYVNELKRRTIRTTEVDVKYGDSLLALSTCNGTFEEGRLVIYARLVREGEDPYSGTDKCEQNPNIKWPSSYYKWNGGAYDPNAFTPYG